MSPSPVAHDPSVAYDATPPQATLGEEDEKSAPDMRPTMLAKAPVV